MCESREAPGNRCAPLHGMAGNRAAEDPGAPGQAAEDAEAIINHPSSIIDAQGLYVHVPVCRSKCRYCGFYSVPAGGVDAGRLVRALVRELERYDGRAFRTAYIGGGSPTALPADELIGLVTRVREHCPAVGEFTVECNPGQVDGDLLAGLRDAGVDRLSVGAQSMLAGELELLGRGHSVEQVDEAVRLARRAGFANLSLDLIFAIPGSTLADWRASLEAAVGLDVEHVSAYSLSFEAGTVFDEWRRTGRLAAVDEELDRAMYEWAIERLERAGLEQYEISNFARPGFECRHNLGYWRNRPYVGIGPAAASWLPTCDPEHGVRLHCGAPADAIRQGGGRTEATRAARASAQAGPCEKAPGGGDVVNAAWRCASEERQAASDEPSDGARATSHRLAGGAMQGWRLENDADVERYVAAVEAGREPPRVWQAVSAAEAACETAVLGLRTRAGIDRADFRRRTGREATAAFGEAIERYEGLGLVEVTGRAVRLTRRALPIADAILCDFAILE